ncbi:NAD(P)/FAD-dependent oxidoreductase [Streptomyces sp. RK75]|uniref:FAD-dependent oxidoreductase n=1 Tax=Streptomyces sp. RK75 TaxID=2824895 RepID=UPI001B38F54A|nr:NAD(P)/FAD-dependent oxidoreductase [Streptomyces sp. RK75]MBQ0863760.1 NAD(P)-binding protein [Streptomyces sp. RK75]
MSLSRKQLIKAMAAGTTAAVGLSPGIANASVGRGRLIECDVCVIGGGASGTYTAMRLRELGRDVLVVERTDRLGGHTETYRDPATGRTAEVGLLIWRDLPIVRDFFDKLDVPVEISAGRQEPPKFADFRTGRLIDYQYPPTTVMSAYLRIRRKYPFLEAGFDLPDPVPSELLMPFREFAAEHNLGSLVPFVFRALDGFGNLLDLPTLYIMKGLDIDGTSRIIKGHSFLTTKARNNGGLYEKATARLGDDVLFGAELTGVAREDGGVTLRAATPQGVHTIRAKRVVFTAPPVPGNLAPFDLDDTERALFGRFRSTFFYTGLLRLPGVPDNLTVQNATAEPPFHTPAMPVTYFIEPSGVTGLHKVKYGSTVALTHAQVRARVLADIRRLVAAGTLPRTTMELETLKSHSPYALTVSRDDIADGFYRRLYSLQGRNRTFYNGAAFQTHDSSLLWQFTERLLPRLDQVGRPLRPR